MTLAFDGKRLRPWFTSKWMLWINSCCLRECADNWALCTTIQESKQYALESLRLQMQVKAILSPHLAQHIMWDRFINTRRGAGKNIPCHLHNKHVNRLIKYMITSTGGNMTEEAMQRAA